MNVRIAGVVTCAFTLGCASYSVAPDQTAAAPSGYAEKSADFGGGNLRGGYGGEAIEAIEEEPADDEDGWGDSLAEGKVRQEEARVASARKPRNRPTTPKPPGSGGDEGRIREWFPEAFLWQPMVETNDDGVASVDVRVPDQLTTWRVLALAHSAEGQQAGTTHTFDTRLPMSVDPITPGWLYVGDQVVVPSQVVSMGDPFSGDVSVSGGGSLSGFGGGPVAVSGGGSRVVSAFMVAEKSGIGTVTAELRDLELIDGAERKVVVNPSGRPITTQRGGVLSGPRTFTLENDRASEERVLVQVFPGPLAVLHSELDRIADSPPGAYGYALIDGVRTLSQTAGVEVDEAALRTLRIRSWQRVVRQARLTDGFQAATLVAGLKNPTDSLAATTRDRLVRVVEERQRGDGTWSTQARSTVQQVLVQTAFSARVLPESSAGPRIRASGALERNLPNVDDPYTAAWMLASGVIDESLRPQLQDIVVEGLNVGPDGTRALIVPEGVRDPAGLRPTRAQALAVTWLALADREDLPWRGDLVSELLQGWSAERGFGAGWADVIALDAVRGGLASLDKPVSVVLEVDGQEIARASVDPAQPKVPAVLEGRLGGEVTVRSEPPVPGLAFVAQHTAWVPFSGTESLPGVEVEVASGPLVSGRETNLTLTVAAPSGAKVEITQGIPAGTAVTVPQTTRSMLTGTPRVEQDRVVMTTRAFGAGEVLEIELRVTPTFAGRMATRPLELRAAGQSAQLKPMVWNVSRGGGS